MLVNMTDVTETADWIIEKTLGTGGFGTVVLWRHKMTNERLALKKCRLANDPLLTPKLRERWNLEVEIMQKLNHANVVKALPLPSQLVVGAEEMPVLAMEYCSKGDLRKIISNSENCCGLTETKVRNLIRDISSAVNYLHSRRIIHRDLKPENIVVQDMDGKSVYKLTDLGYAKELDQISVCNSFVGTLQYLAPELFMSQEYTCTVDYWSLGLVAHECMVGVRPFLPTMTPAEWMKHVCRKKSTDICVYMSMDGVITYCQHIFKENQLSKPFVVDMEKWLQVVLEWNPHKRGIDLSSGTKRFIPHSMFEEMYNKKIIHFFVVGTGKVHSYVIESDTLVREVLDQLSQDVGILRENLECLHPGGQLVEDNKLASELTCTDLLDDEEWICFVYYKGKYDCNQIEHAELSLIEHLQTSKINSYKSIDWNKIWSNAVYFVLTEMKLEKRLTQAYDNLRKYLNACNSTMLENCKKLTMEMNKLMAKLEFYQECLNSEIAAYEHANRTCQIKSKKVEDYLYTHSETIANDIRQMQDAIIKYEMSTKAISFKVDNLQKSVCQKDYTSMSELYKKALEVHSVVKRKKNDRRTGYDVGPMLDVVAKCHSCREQAVKQILNQLHRVQELKEQVIETFPPFDKSLYNIETLNRRLVSLQIDRQNTIWKGFCAIGRSKTETVLSNSLRPIEETNADEDALPNQPVSLSSILNKVSQDSTNTIQENLRLRSKWHKQFDNLGINPKENLNWDFINKMDSKK